MMTMSLMKMRPVSRSSKSTNFPNLNFTSNRKDICAFEIDSNVKDGRLAFIYRGSSKP